MNFDRYRTKILRGEMTRQDINDLEGKIDDKDWMQLRALVNDVESSIVKDALIRLGERIETLGSVVESIKVDQMNYIQEDIKGVLSKRYENVVAINKMVDGLVAIANELKNDN